MIFRLMTVNPIIEKPLVQAWVQGDESLVVGALKNLRNEASRQDKELLSMDVLDILQETQSARIRDAAAIALVDLGVRQSVMKIVDVLRRPGFAKSSGTLLFALNEIQASLPLSVLMQVVVEGSFESRNQAMFFLEEGRFDRVDPSYLQSSIDRLETLMDAEDPETVEAADFARQCLLDYSRER